MGAGLGLSLGLPGVGMSPCDECDEGVCTGGCAGDPWMPTWFKQDEGEEDEGDATEG